MLDDYQEAYENGYRVGYLAGLKAAARVCDQQAHFSNLPDAHGGWFAKQYARNALLGCAALIENLPVPTNVSDP